MRTIAKKAIWIPIAAMVFATQATGALATESSDHHKKKDIVDVAASAGSFNTLVAAVKAAGLVETLKGDGPFTVFAPTDEAFAKLPAGTVESLLKPENKDQLVAILTYHVISGKFKSTDLLSTAGAGTVNGASLPIGLRVGEANVVTADVEASNGVIHIIDAVLIPPKDMSAAITPEMQIIRDAIAVGAPLYNQGNAMACASVYEIAATAVLGMGNVSSAAATHLSAALAESGDAAHADRRAWIMREGLDAAYAVMQESSFNIAQN